MNTNERVVNLLLDEIDRLKEKLNGQVEEYKTQSIEQIAKDKIIKAIKTLRPDIDQDIEVLNIDICIPQKNRDNDVFMQINFKRL